MIVYIEKLSNENIVDYFKLCLRLSIEYVNDKLKCTLLLWHSLRKLLNLKQK